MVGYLCEEKIVQQQAHVRLSVYSFSTYLLSARSKLSIVFGIRKEMVGKMAFMEFTLQWGVGNETCKKLDSYSV